MAVSAVSDKKKKVRRNLDFSACARLRGLFPLLPLHPPVHQPGFVVIMERCWPRASLGRLPLSFVRSIFHPIAEQGMAAPSSFLSYRVTRRSDSRCSTTPSRCSIQVLRRVSFEVVLFLCEVLGIIFLERDMAMVSHIQYPRILASKLSGFCLLVYVNISNLNPPTNAFLCTALSRCLISCRKWENVQSVLHTCFRVDPLWLRSDIGSGGEPTIRGPTLPRPNRGRLFRFALCYA